MSNDHTTQQQPGTVSGATPATAESAAVARPSAPLSTATPIRLSDEPKIEDALVKNRNNWILWRHHDGSGGSLRITSNAYAAYEAILQALTAERSCFKDNKVPAKIPKSASLYAIDVSPQFVAAIEKSTLLSNKIRNERGPAAGDTLQH